MKYLIPFLLLFSSVALAGGDHRKTHKHYDVQLQGQAQQQQQQVIVNQYEDDDGDIGIDVDALERRYNAVSASASSLDLAYCSDGGSAQYDQGGFSFGQMNYICEAAAALKVTLLLIEMELAAAGLNHSSDAPDWVHVNQAHLYMMDAEEIMTNVVEYIDQRDDTAALGANARDITWPLLLVVLLFAL